MSKSVVYLFGAGSTQAVLKACAPGVSLLTADIQSKIQSKYSSRGIDNRVWSELITPGNDVEHLISVLETQHNYYASERIRKYYRDAIVEISSPTSENPPPKNLYAVLIDLHKNIKFDEQLACFITLNYENILENTIKKLFNMEVDYCLFPDSRTSNSNTIKVLKLHGSFNWLNTRPVKIRKKMTAIHASNTLWIPPGVDKKKDNYPFNLLWGHAIENLLECDILRIIGCSLSRNDWGLIPILYTVQRFNQEGKVIDIEIIDYPDIADKIEENYKYMKFKKITDIQELLNFYQKLFPSASSAGLIKEIKSKFADKDRSNPFYEWLDSKIDYLHNDLGMNIQTPKSYVYNFYNKI